MICNHTAHNWDYLEDGTTQCRGCGEIIDRWKDEARLAAEIQKRGRLLGGGVSVALLAAAVERLQGELAEARAEVERVRDQERRATIKYLEQMVATAQSAGIHGVVHVLRIVARGIEAGRHLLIVGDA